MCVCVCVCVILCQILNNYYWSYAKYFKINS